MSTCPATNRVTDVTFHCSRERGHRGRHIARGIGGVVVRMWQPTLTAVPNLPTQQNGTHHDRHQH